MNPRRSVIMLSIALVAAGAVWGCGGDDKRAKAPTRPAPALTSETRVTSAPVAMPVSPSISVSEDIARVCNLHFDDVTTAPKFDFDRSELLPADHEVLGQIGRCVTTGPLAGQSIMLVGRADPRGTVEYNMALGARRAHAVGAFLGQLGVDPAHMRETSRGELDAMGTDEATWQIDRRVDIVLVE